MFARVLGPYLVIVPIAGVFRASQMQALMSGFEASALWPWVLGAFVLLLGLIVVALHSSWADPPAVIVSVVGWLMVLRGVLLLAFPAAFMSAANAVIGTGVAWRVGYAILALIGLYLTCIGWSPAPQRRESGASV